MRQQLTPLKAEIQAKKRERIEQLKRGLETTDAEIQQTREMTERLKKAAKLDELEIARLQREQQALQEANEQLEHSYQRLNGV